MKTKSFLPFVLLTIILASFHIVSCNRDDSDNDGYSAWRDVTAADSAVFAQAKAAYLNDSVNVKTINYKILQFLPAIPMAVRTQAVEGKGTNYQFAFLSYTVTVYKGDSDAVGRITEIVPGANGGDGIDFPPGYIPPIPPNPQKRDTLIK